MLNLKVGWPFQNILLGNICSLKHLVDKKYFMPPIFSEVYRKYLIICLTLSVCQSVRVSQCVSVFQNSYQGTSSSCRELKFCLDVVCTSQHTSNHQRSLAEQCHTQKFYLRCFKSDFDAVKSKFGLLTEQIEKTTSK